MALKDGLAGELFAALVARVRLGRSAVLDLAVVAEEVLAAELDLAVITGVLEVLWPSMDLVEVLLDTLKGGPVLVGVFSLGAAREGTVVAAVQGLLPLAVVDNWLTLAKHLVTLQVVEVLVPPGAAGALVDVNTWILVTTAVGR